MNLFHTPLIPRAALLFALMPMLCIAATEKKDVDLTEKKIRLMSEALQAQEAGDFVTARTKLEALLVYSPSDAQVNRLLQAVAAGMLARENAVREAALHPRAIVAPAPVIQEPRPSDNLSAAAPAPQLKDLPSVAQTTDAKSEEPIDAATLAERETARQRNLMAVSRTKLSHGLSLASEERFKEALRDFLEADLSLPRNLLTEPLRLEIEAARNDTQHRQRLVGFAQNGPLLRYSVIQRPAEGLAHDIASEGVTSTITLDVHLLDMSPDAYADLLAAWAQFSRDARLGASGRLVLLDRNGNQVFFRRAAPLPTGRQISLYWSLLGAALKPDKSTNLTSPEGIVGVSGSFDPVALVKSISRLDGCRVLAAPQVIVQRGTQSVLTLANDGGAVAGSSGLGSMDSSPRTGVEVKITPVSVTSADAMEFVINPAIVQYEGRSLTDATNPLYSRHESSTRLSLLSGSSAIFGGLVREEGRAIAGRETPVQRFPLVGRILRERAAAGRLRELVVIVTRR